MKLTRQYALILFGVISMHMSVIGQYDPSEKTEIEKTVEEEATSLIVKFDKAVLERDLVALQSYLAEDFIMITPIGSVMTREQLLMPFKSDSPNKSQLIEASTSGFIVHTYEQSAVVTAITSHSFEASSNRPVSKYRNTYTIVQVGDHWQIAAIHGFKLPN